jgi:hypothetical protein
VADAHIPTDENRRKAAMYAGLGLTHEQIGSLLNISHNTVAKYYGEDIDRGKAEMIAKVAGNLAQRALQGDKIAQIFYLKCQAGWKDTSTFEHTGAGGSALFPRAIEWNVQEPKQIEGRVIESEAGD